MHRSRPRSSAALVAVVLSFAASAASAATTSHAPSDWPAAPRASSSAGFSIVQMATTQAKAFVRDWNRPGPHAEIHGETLVRPGQSIDTFIAFRGCRADPAGRCNITATFEITGPGGKPQTSPPMDVWANQTQPAPGMIYLSRASLGLAFAPADPTGPYRIRAAVTDHVAGITLRTEQVLTLLK